jgi:hypothetical protein
MARILSDADVLLKVQAEISDALAVSDGIFSLEMLQQLPYLGHCIKVNFCSSIWFLMIFFFCLYRLFNLGIAAFACQRHSVASRLERR